MWVSLFGISRHFLCVMNTYGLCCVIGAVIPIGLNLNVTKQISTKFGVKTRCGFRLENLLMPRELPK